jgi:hypothetical protein
LVIYCSATTEESRFTIFGFENAGKEFLSRHTILSPWSIRRTSGADRQRRIAPVLQL